MNRWHFQGLGFVEIIHLPGCPATIDVSMAQRKISMQRCNCMSSGTGDGKATKTTCSVKVRNDLVGMSRSKHPNGHCSLTKENKALDPSRFGDNQHVDKIGSRYEQNNSNASIIQQVARLSCFIATCDSDLGRTCCFVRFVATCSETQPVASLDAAASPTENLSTRKVPQMAGRRKVGAAGGGKGVEASFVAKPVPLQRNIIRLFPDTQKSANPRALELIL